MMKKSIFVFNNGIFKRKDNTLYFETEQARKYLPVEDTKEIYVFGEVDLNKKFLDFCSQKEILLHFFNHYGYYSGTFYPREHQNAGYVIVEQVRHYINEGDRLRLATRFVLGAVKNMVQVMNYYRHRGKKVESYQERMETLFTQLNNMKDVSQLMAIEGNIREQYYQSFDLILEKEHFQFQSRTRRPPKNNLNTLISFGNSMLYTMILSEIYKTHLDPRIGYLHTTNFRRFTLNLDVAEIFKPIIIDRLIFTLIGKKMITHRGFEKKLEGVAMKEKTMKTFVSELDKRLQTTIQHRNLGRSVSYRRLIRLELYKLQKYFVEKEDYQPFVAQW
jgi:CRISPR-associated protein Cas1